MNIVLLDDEEDLLETEAALIRELGNNVVTFSSGNDLLVFSEKKPKAFDAAVLDIILRDQPISGIETARALRDSGFEGPIVFLSSSKEYGPESYEVNAAGYFEKPITPLKIGALLNIVSGIISRQKMQNEPFLMLINGRDARKLLFCDILFVEVTKNTLNFHTTDGDVISVRAPLKEYAPKLLSDKRFAESHRAYIVNIDYVTAIKGCDAVMIDGSKVLIAKTHTEFKAKFIRSQLGGGYTFGTAL
jgi:two-component system LytT family response regulator